MTNPGVLYLVALPIGNLEDITFRAVRILKEADLIAAEDTRHTLKLLSHFDIHGRTTSYHKFNHQKKCNELIAFLKSGKKIALVSDAGTPGISDPGEFLVNKCIEENINIIPVPGPCALISALISSGFSTERFTFFGYLPVSGKERKEYLEDIKSNNNTLILYESPHRLIKTIEDLFSVIPERKIAIAKEITKKFESFLRGTIPEIKKIFSELREIRGEYVIVIENFEKNKLVFNDEDIKSILLENGKIYSAGSLVKNISRDYNIPRNKVYKLYLELKNETE